MKNTVIETIAAISAITEAAGRNAAKALSKGKALGFNLRTFGPEAILAPYMEQINTLRNYTTDDLKDPESLQTARQQYAEFKAQLLSDINKPFTVIRRQGRPTRLNRSLASDIFGIEYGSAKPTDTWVVADHQFQKILAFNTKILGTNAADAAKELTELQTLMYERLGNRGLLVAGKDAALRYGGFAASASHQKKEKLIMAESNAMKVHEKAIWFGKTMAEFLSTAKCTGADIWKARANLIRPCVQALRTAEGEEIHLRDLLVVADVEKTFHIANARIFGGEKLYEDTATDAQSILGDGAVLSLTKLEMQGQTTGAGIKGFCLDGTSAIDALCLKHGITVQQFLDTVVTDINGKACRIGDYKLICGEGCFKFDKFGYANFAEYVSRIEALTTTYPGLDKLYLLRQADEVEGEEKARHLTRTLIQQWMDIDLHSMLRITRRAMESLKRQKTFRGAAFSMAELGKDEEDRTDTGRIFAAAPWLITAPAVQQYLENTWVKRQAQAAGGHLRCNGSYPYIMQDPVALLEVWVLGVDPNTETLGVLRGDEVSVDQVPADKEILCVRFPANFQTAKVMTCRPCVKAFASCGNVAIISVHSDILIRQDGDVDGDEMAVITDHVAVELTKRMEEKYHPPVVIFAHGSKAQKITFMKRSTYIHEAYTALWRAKRFDSVGTYANLAMKCSYLAGIAEQDGNTVLRDQYLVWMSAASTGAIMAIDQVKGNQVDMKLVNWLDGTIQKKVFSAMNYLMPFVQQYAKAGYAADKCLPEDDRSICDNIAGYVLRTTGKFEMDTQDVLWNAKAAEDSLLCQDVRTGSVRKAPVCGSFLNQLADNWFNDKADDDAEIFDAIRSGKPVSQDGLLLLLWRNACALAFRMDGETLNDKRQEYYKACRDMLFAQADSTEWVASMDGHVFTEEEKHASVINSAVRFALELRHSNKVKTDSKGSFAMFVLRVFAKDILQNLQAHPAKAADFNLENIDLTIDDEPVELYDDSEVEAPAVPVEDGLFQDDLDGVVFTDDSFDSFIA